MMDFVCTEKMDVESQVKVIGKEIQNEYPEIFADQILKMAVLSDTVHKNVTADTIFQRYYIILQILGKKSPLYNKVYSDMVDICYEKLVNKIYYNLCNDLVKYQNGLINEFPCISDYFEEGNLNENIKVNNEEYKGDLFKNEKEKNVETINSNEKNINNLPISIQENKSIWIKIKEFLKKLLKK